MASDLEAIAVCGDHRAVSHEWIEENARELARLREVEKAAREALYGASHDIQQLPNHERCAWCNLGRALSAEPKEGS